MFFLDWLCCAISLVCAHYDHKSFFNTDTRLTHVCGFPRKNEVWQKGKYRKMPFE